MGEGSCSGSTAISRTFHILPSLGVAGPGHCSSGGGVSWADLHLISKLPGTCLASAGLLHRCPVQQPPLVFRGRTSCWLWPQGGYGVSLLRLGSPLPGESAGGTGSFRVQTGLQARAISPPQQVDGAFPGPRAPGTRQPIRGHHRQSACTSLSWCWAAGAGGCRAGGHQALGQAPQDRGSGPEGWPSPMAPAAPEQRGSIAPTLFLGFPRLRVHPPDHSEGITLRCLAVRSTCFRRRSPNPFPPFPAYVARMHFPGSCSEAVARPEDLRKPRGSFRARPRTCLPSLATRGSYKTGAPGHGGSRAETGAAPL